MEKRKARHWSVLVKDDVFLKPSFQHIANFYQRAYSDYRVCKEVSRLKELFEKKEFTIHELQIAYKEDLESIKREVQDVIKTYGISGIRL